MKSHFAKLFSPLALGTTLLYGFSVPALAQNVFPPPDSVTAQMLQMEHRYDIGNGDTLLVAQRRTPEPYRICAKDASAGIPLEVRVDGQMHEIAAGTCDNVVGKDVSVVPGTTLSNDTVLNAHIKDVETVAAR